MRGSLVTITGVVLVVSTACGGLSAPEETTVETLEIESVDLPGRLWEPFMPPLSEGTEVTVDGRLTIPPTEGPVPAVIVTHGCGGVGGAERGWVDDLTGAGFGVLLLDSFGGRSIATVCFGRETVNVSSILVDVFRAAEALDAHPYIDGSRLAVMGLSFGRGAALWSSITEFQDLYGGEPLDAYIAFYPSTCFIRLEDEAEVSGGPIRIFHGTEDDWTPIDQCQEYVDRIAARGVDAGLFAFDGARHSFDNETLPISGFSRLNAPSPRNCDFFEMDGEIVDPDSGGVAGVESTCVELGVTYGYDPAAHAEARSLLIDLLTETLGQD
jgi:dienelactone hydrolase